MNRTDKLLDKVKNNGMDAVSITDHGVMYGVPEFWMMAKDFGVKPIIGCEMYLAPGDMRIRKDIDGIRYYHLLLIAKNFKGYQNLVKMVSESHLHGMYYKPRVDVELLKKHSEGIICTSACLAGPLSRHIVRDELEKAESWLKTLHSIFKDDFYLEIQRNGVRCEDRIDEDLINSYPSSEREDHFQMVTEQVKVNNQLYDWSKKYNIPVVATTDAHYLDKEDKDTQKVLFCIRDGKSINDETALNGYMETYIKTPEELKLDFSDIPEVMSETVKISEKIEEFDIMFDRVQPQFWNLPKEMTAKDELAREAFQGAIRKYAKDEAEKLNEDKLKKLSVEEAKKYLEKDKIERIEYELEVIHEKGYDDYFLVVSDIMKWSASQGILTGVRGSVAGSVVAHCLDIVEVDPIKWELYFERFLNPERPSPPDIDMDIQDSRRDELIDYVKDKYGEEAVAAICAIGRLKTKAAIRDVARVMGIDLALADKLSKMVTVLFGKPFTFEEMMETDPEFKRIVDVDPRLQELGEVVTKIEGLARHMSVHACGYLVTPGPIVDYTALQRETGGDKVITQWEGPWIEELGLMKFDFLGLRTLSIISDAIEYINQDNDNKIDFFGIPDGDKETYELFARGETVGVFQFESPPMQKYLMDLQPTTQEDLCFMAAAYRPGPMKYIPDYIACKHGKKDPEFLVPELKDIVGYTYGFAIYQEQVIKIAVELGGYSMGGADLLRRAMGKKKMKIMKEEEPKFKEGVKSKGYSQKIADTLWEYLLPFADYGFNKAHAAGYAVLAYKCAYLKAHYPLEFMTALMHADLENSDRIVVDINEAKRLGFKILQPDINKSGVYFLPEGEDGIRFGLGAIKNVGVTLCGRIVKERKENGNFKNLDDFVTRVGTKNINKRSLECLINAGAMDEFGDRNALSKIIPEVFEKINKDEKARELGQTGLFNMMDEHDGEQEVEATKLPEIEKATDKEKLAWEKDLLGIFVSTHPLDKFSWAIVTPGYFSTNALAKLPNQTSIKMIAMLSDIKVVHTKKDNKRMAVMRIEDTFGKVPAVIFPRTFEKYADVGLINEAKALLIEGKINYREDEMSVIIESLDTAESTFTPKDFKIDISDVSDQDTLVKLKSCFDDKGDVEVKIIYGNGKKKEMVRKTYFNEETLRVLGEYAV